MTFETDTIKTPSSNKAGFDSPLERVPRAAEWHYPRFLWRVFPASVRNALRETRVRILSAYLTRHLPRNKVFEQPAGDALASESLSIIVPVHDAPEVVARCLTSLEKYAPKAEIILVDDASRLEETSAILEDFSSRNGWRLIRQPPLGHSAASRAGARLASRPYLCILNSDTVVTPWCWRQVTSVFEDNPTIGIVGPSTSASGNPQALALASFTRNYLNDSQIWEYARLLSTECADPLVTDLDWVSGFALFIRRSLWEDLGGFDGKLPDYGNDVELCRRAKAAGYRTAWVRNSYIHHLGGKSYDKAIGVESIFARSRAAAEYVKTKHGISDL